MSCSSSPREEFPKKAYAIGQDHQVLNNFKLRNLDICAPHLLPHLRPDSHVLDVGCGPGSITADIAARCPAGRAVGIDCDERAIAAATSTFGQPSATDGEATEVAAAPCAEFVLGDAFANLPFSDASFDIVHGHQTAQFVDDVPAALREWRRVLRVGGLLALRVGWVEGMVCAPPNARAFRLLARALNGSYAVSGGSADVLSRVPALAKQAGFGTVHASMGTNVMESAEMRATFAAFIGGEGLAKGWREHGLVTEDEIIEIRTAVAAVEHAEVGFFMVPNVQLICHAE